MNPCVLVTGGAGYVGSHVTLLLLQAGFTVVVLDNLCNSRAESLDRIGMLSGKAPEFVRGDVRDSALLRRLFSVYPVQVVFHLAGLKSVGESVIDPLTYYSNNVYGSEALLKSMQDARVFRLVFSSSAAVYGNPGVTSVAEDFPVGHVNSPYAETKLLVEQMLRSASEADPRWRIAILRYFNPVSAHPSGLIGEDPCGNVSNLLPVLAQVAGGRLAELTINGDDYPTPDGTCIRDYVHVLDLAEGHLSALRFLGLRPGVDVWNLGAGRGYSVLEIVRAFEAASGRRVPCRTSTRRPGDVAGCFADTRRAKEDLGWTAHRDLDEMMCDLWRWYSKNPAGLSFEV